LNLIGEAIKKRAVTASKEASIRKLIFDLFALFISLNRIKQSRRASAIKI
jgi:hypothetical protein